MSEIKNYINDFFPELYKEALNDKIKNLRSQRNSKPDNISELNKNLENINTNQIVIIADRPTIQTSRISLGFAQLGYRVNLLSRWPSEKINLLNKNICLYEYNNLRELENLKVKKNINVFVTSWIGYNFYPLLISEIIQKKIIAIHNDFPDILLNNLDDCEYLGMNKKAYKKDIDFFYKTCENSKLNLNTIYSPNLNCPFSEFKNKLFFPMKPMKIFNNIHCKFKRKIDNSIIFTGMIPNEVKLDRLFKDAKLTYYLNNVPISKLRHCLLSSPYKYQNNLEKQFPTIHRIQKKYGSRFKFLTGLPFYQIPYIAGHFSWALFYMNCKSQFDISKKHYENIIPTKIASYLENRLPIIYNETYKYTANLISKNKLGFCINDESLKTLDTEIKKNKKNLDKFNQNIQEYIKKNNLEDAIKTELIPRIN